MRQPEIVLHSLVASGWSSPACIEAVLAAVDSTVILLYATRSDSVSWSIELTTFHKSVHHPSAAVRIDYLTGVPLFNLVVEVERSTRSFEELVHESLL